MNKLFTAGIVTLIIFLSGCNSSEPIDRGQLDDFEVSQTIDETVEGDFVFRLVSEKEEYNESEEVELYGELEYVGEKDEVTIHHSSSAILFPMEEKVRGYDIGFAVNDIGNATTLQQGEPYREEYVKSGGYSRDQDPEDYITFIQDFLNRDGFLPGYYVVNGFADFSIRPGEDRDEWEDFKIGAEIDFKVKE
jgi:hypothetical protein